MDFSYNDFITNSNIFDVAYVGNSTIDSAMFVNMDKEFQKDGDPITKSFEELERRIDNKYYNRLFMAQTKAFTFSQNFFAPYKFILPDVVTDDWLSIVDWHKKYPTRDHSLHQSLTASIVAKLLGNGKPVGSLKIYTKEGNLLDFCVEKMLNGPKMNYLRHYMLDLCPSFNNMSEYEKRRWARDVFYETSIIASLFHDIGYPWQFVNTLSKKIGYAEYANGNNQSAVDTRNNIENRLLIYPFYGYSEANKKHPTPVVEQMVVNLISEGLSSTHGLPGALGFMCLNDKVRIYSKNPDLYEASYRLILDWAAVGIMMHDMVGLYWGKNNKISPQHPILRLSMDVDPMSCIIAMADILEEFCRPKAVFKKDEDDKNEKVFVDYGHDCTGTEIEINDRKLNIIYYYNSQILATNARSRRKREVDEYFDSETGFVDLSPIGITKVDCDTAVKAEPELK